MAVAGLDVLVGRADVLMRIMEPQQLEDVRKISLEARLRMTPRVRVLPARLLALEVEIGLTVLSDEGQRLPLGRRRGQVDFSGPRMDAVQRVDDRLVDVAAAVLELVGQRFGGGPAPDPGQGFRGRPPQDQARGTVLQAFLEGMDGRVPVLMKGVDGVLEGQVVVQLADDSREVVAPLQPARALQGEA